MAVVDEYLVAQYAQLHQGKYGQSGMKFAEHANVLVGELGARSVLDYGCGQSDLGRFLDQDYVEFVRYDPSIPEIATLPDRKFDLVMNTDVLEHIPESDVDDVIASIAGCSQRVFFNISCRPAKVLLPDGQNAHLTILSPEQWLERMRRTFPKAVIVGTNPAEKDVTITTWPTTSGTLLRLIDRIADLEKKLSKKPGLTRLVAKIRKRL